MSKPFKKLFGEENPQKNPFEGFGVDDWWDRKRKIRREALLAAKFGTSHLKPCYPTQKPSEGEKTS